MRSYSHLTDKELIELYGSLMPNQVPEPLLNELMERMMGGVVPVARRMRGMMSVALSEEDLIQSALMICLRKLNRYHGLNRAKGSLSAWAARLALRLYLDLIRVRQNQKMESLDSEDASDGEPSSAVERLQDWRVRDPQDVLIEVETLDDLREAIQGLPMMYRSVITNYLAGRSVQEISDILNRRPSSIRWRYQRAVEMLRERLTP